MYLKDPIYVSGTSGRRSRRPSTFRQISNLLFIALVIGVNYVVFFQAEEAPTVPVIERPDQTETEPTVEPAPINTDEAVPAPELDDEQGDTAVVRSFKGRLNKGDTIVNALIDQGLEYSQTMPVTTAMQKVFDFRKAQVGNRFEGTVDGTGQIQSFRYVTSPVDVYVVTLAEGEYVASKKNIPVDRRTLEFGCTVDSSLFASMTRCGEGPELAQKVTELFSFDVDFFQEIRRGDVLRVVVDKVYVNGRFLKYDRIKAARYEGKFGVYTALLYKDRQGVEAYYTEKGRALQKEFLKTPLKYTRISSGYTNRRYHPVLHKWKRHLAIDYAAPINTPVQAVATGTVKFVGKKGASGNLIVIKHSGNYSSYYAHLNKFGRVKVGDRVDQRTVIGYVGQTGRATGPHLHFALKHGKKWVNPLKVKYTTANPIKSDERPRFNREIRALLASLSGINVQDLGERRG